MKQVRIAWLTIAAVSVGCVVWLVIGDPSPARFAEPIASGIASAVERGPSGLAERIDGQELEVPAARKEASAEVAAFESVPSTNESTASAAESSIRVRVVDDLGAPVEECKVEGRILARQVEWRTDSTPVMGKPSHSGASPAGVFVFDRLRDGEWEFVARSDTGVRSAPGVKSIPAEAAEVTLVLPRPTSVIGAVGSKAGGVVAGAQVFVDFAGKESRRGVRSDAEEDAAAKCDAYGRFEIASLQPGTIRFRAKHPDYADGEWMGQRLAPGERGVVQLELSQGGRVFGVVDPLLGSVSGRQVDLFSFRGSEGWETSSSDAGGRFEFLRVMPQDYIIELRPEGYPRVRRGASTESIRRRISVREGESTEVHFSQDAAAIPVGGVVLRAGSAVEGISIGVRAVDGVDDRERSTETASDGRFALAVERPGEHEFRVWKSRSSARFQRSIGADGDQDLVLDLPAGRISGSVESPDGAPVAWVSVSLALGDDGASMGRNDFMRRYWVTKAGADGKFEFDFLPPGSYVLRAPDGHALDQPKPRTPFGGVVLHGIAVGDISEVDVRAQLTREGTISGRVLGSDGLPVDNAFIDIQDASGSSRFGLEWDVRSDVTGSFRAESLAPGSYTVRARSKEGTGTTSGVLVVGGESTSVTVDIR